MRAEALKGHLDGLLLAALEAGPKHGYAVRETLRELTDGTFDLPTGHHPALHRLERAGLIAGEWQIPEQGRRRRVYRLTARGRRALREERGGWTTFAAAVSAVLGAEPWPTTR